MAEMVLDDGRRLTYQMVGVNQGSAVIVLHGTPGSSRQLAGLHRVAVDSGIALIAADRPGYGGSSYDPNGTIASYARDVAALIECLAIENCSIIGLSGGGPYALACGVLFAEHVGAVATIGSVAPSDAHNLWALPDRVLLELAKHSTTLARLAMASTIGVARKTPERALSWFEKFVAEPDRRLLREDVELRNGFLDDLRQPGPSAARAAAHDYRQFGRSWDVDLSKMTIPTHVWHGTADRTVPVANAHVIAERCPTAELHLVEQGGHLLFREFASILSALGAKERPH